MSDEISSYTMRERVAAHAHLAESLRMSVRSALAVLAPEVADRLAESLQFEIGLHVTRKGG